MTLQKHIERALWIITKDCISSPDETNSKGVCSNNYKEEYSYGEGTKLPHKFRLSDDDGEIYYYGYANSNNDNKAFYPLEDFAEGYAGCTTIEYYNSLTKKWEVL